MAHAVSVRTVWSREQIAALKTDPEVEAFTHAAATGLARDLRVAAPKLTGAGAASIEVRPARSKGALEVGWDKAHYYMTIQNSFSTLGSHTNLAFHFAQQTLENYIHT